MLSNNENIPFVEFLEVSKFYKMGMQDIIALDKMTFTIYQGEFVVILGPSGSGKTTIINILGGMDTADCGSVLLETKDITKYNKKELTTFRRHEIGFVFQFYNLVQNLTALENVELATELCKNPLDALQTLKNVGLEDRLNNFPSQLSGGEQQRVSIARALAKNPKLLLCDEPTGALDYETGKTILKLLRDTCKKTGKTVIVITHNQSIAEMADRVIRIKNGKTTSTHVNPTPKEVENIEW